SSLGPSYGQVLSRPVSLETLLRSGPCHWGQSSARTAGPSTCPNRRPATDNDTANWQIFIIGCLMRENLFRFSPGRSHWSVGAREKLIAILSIWLEEKMPRNSLAERAYFRTS